MDENLGPHGLGTSYVPYFSCLILGVQLGFMHFAKFPMLRFSNGYFNQLYGKYSNRGIQAIGHLPNFKTFTAL